MSKAELDRFITAVEENPSLLDAYREVGSPAEMAAGLQAAGYDVSIAEVEEAVRQSREHAAELSDAQLDQVSGGNILLPIGIGLGVAIFTAIPALAGGAVAIGLTVAKKLGAKID